MKRTRFAFPSLAAAVFALGLLSAPMQSMAQAAPAAADAQAVADITALLEDFLAHVDARATHDRFWAADLVYTSSGGEVKDKASILKSFDEPSAPAAAEPAAPPDRYTAEDILVRPHGDAAALTFRLVHHAADGTRSHFRNSGMLLRRDGRWEVITWQATKVPVPEAK